MALRVGIPRALFYYYYYPWWETFFRELGAETVLSSPTHKGIIEAGVRAAVDEACLPVKVYYGHVLELAEKVDYLFLPRLVSMEHRSYICPKFMGLPDMLRSSQPQLLPRIIDLCVDRSQNDRQYQRGLYRVGSIFTRNPWKIKKAVQAAEEKLAEYRALLQAGCLPVEALERLYADCFSKGGPNRGSAAAQGLEVASLNGPDLVKLDKPDSKSNLKKAGVLNISAGQGPDSAAAGAIADASTAAAATVEAPVSAADIHPLTIGLLGHGYTIYDDYVSRQTIRKLRELGANVVTPDLLSPEVIEKGVSQLPKRMFWSLGKQILGGAFHFFEQQNVDGIIHLACFGCGPDSLIAELVEIEAHRRKALPFMMLTMDEHTGEAGIITRLEAFMDMIRRQRGAYLWQEVPI